MHLVRLPTLANRPDRSEVDTSARHVNPARVLTAFLAAASIACVVVAVRGEAEVQVGSARAIDTPLWSVRRVPQPVVDSVGAQRLQIALDGVVAGTDACFTVRSGDAELVSHGTGASLIPASTEKLLTGAVALDVLGADTRLVTRVVAEEVRNGTVENLWLVGGGDPLIVTPELVPLLERTPQTRGIPTTSLAALADSVVASGVRNVTGGIVGDDSRYDTLRYLPGWKASYRVDGEVGPLGALTVNGGFTAVLPRPVPVDDPAVFAASELGRLLADRGVAIGGSPTRGTAPKSASEIAKVESAPLQEIVGVAVLRSSDNLAAELLTREIGLAVASESTTAAGTRSIAERLERLGAPTEGLVLTDGSGLGRDNRATCGLLDAVLALGSRGGFAALWDGLAVAGQTGTLAEQMQGTPLVGQLRAKSGSLDGVTGLVGIIDVGRPLFFTLVVNGAFTEQAGVRLRTEWALVLASFPDAPDADTLVPAPAGGAEP